MSSQPQSGVLAAIVASLMLLGCASEGGGSQGEDEAASSGPERPCERAFVREEVEAFVGAINGTSREAIADALTDEPAFHAFSHGLDYRARPKRFFASKGAERAAAHLSKRASAGDRTRLVELRMHGGDRSFRICNFSYVVWRKIGDRPGAGERFGGKGAVSFDGGVALWNTGAPSRYSRSAQG